MVETKNKTLENRSGSKSAEVPCYVPYDPLFCECCDHIWKHTGCNDNAICEKCGAKYKDGNISILPLA